MASILNTIGPYTVNRYLNFALGLGIGEPDAGEPEAAVGLEEVAELFRDEESIPEVDESLAETPRALSTINPMESIKDSPPENDLGHAGELDVRKEAPSEADSSTFSVCSLARSEHEHHFFYGVVSDKIGEAAACWLARWGIDILHHELQCTGRELPDSAVPSQPSGSRKRASTVPGPFTNGAFSVRVGTMKATTSQAVKHHVPLIWRRGGLTARWVRGLLSSDMVFVGGEKERYDTARRIVELRRSEGVIDEEEAEYDILFTMGIYYANMVCCSIFGTFLFTKPSPGSR